MNIRIRLLIISLLFSLVTACGGGHNHTGTVQLENNNSSLSISEFNFFTLRSIDMGG